MSTLDREAPVDDPDRATVEVAGRPAPVVQPC